MGDHQCRHHGGLIVFRKLPLLKPPVWYLLAAMTLFSAATILLPLLGIFTGQTLLYIVEPIMGLIVFSIAWHFAHGLGDRVRHKTEKSLIIGSVIAVWFVIYFASGIMLTYQHNAVAASPLAILMNMFAFGGVAAALEYVRHTIMLLGGRRNIVWLGVFVSLLFAVSQVSLTQLGLQSLDAIIKTTVSTIVPTIAGSFLLTYLSFNAGFGPQLTYRLGVLAAALLPPIIPKFDWYMTGISSIILAVAVYVSIDRTRKDIEINGRHYRHARRAYDAMFVVVMVALVAFMTGFFSYKPQAIMSDSMKPVYARGAIVIVQKASAMDAQVGDIVQYDTVDHSVTHRLVRIELAPDGSGTRLYITKGDNSPSEDQPIKPEQIVGIVRAEVPYIGYPSVWLREIIK